MRSRYKVILEGGIYFITSTVVRWIPVFTAEPYFQIIVDSFKYCQQEKALELYAYVIVDNHFHAVVQGPNLSKMLQSIKSYTANKIIEQLQTDNKKWLLDELAFYKKKYKAESEFQLWQEGFHPQLLTDEVMIRQKIEYIHYNPVRRRFVDRPEYWRYSSARIYYLDDDSIITISAI
jgi:putative transposase